jgi:hypothetical protein
VAEGPTKLTAVKKSIFPSNTLHLRQPCFRFVLATRKAKSGAEGEKKSFLKAQKKKKISFDCPVFVFFCFAQAVEPQPLFGPCLVS